MTTGLYLPDGSFQPFDALSLSTELATRDNAGTSLAELGAWLSLLPDPDPVLRARGDDASVLRDLSADDQVSVGMMSRKNRVLNCPHFTLRPGAPEGQPATEEAKTLHTRLMQDLERANMRTIISGILDAPFYGMTVLEIIWKPADSWWHIADIIPRPVHWFGFDRRNNPVFVGEFGNYAAEPRPLPPGKFVISTHHATYDNPYGLRLLSRCLWPCAFKRGGLQFYARFVERHGMPWVVGEAAPRADRQKKREMAADLARMVQDCVAVIPAGAKVDFLNAGQTQGALHESYLARQDRAISKILMGQTLTVEMEGANSLAAAETHKGVADDLADADKAMVVDAWNEIAWLYAQVNSRAGQTSATPAISLAPLAPLASYDEPDDLLSRAELDKKLSDMGVSFTREHFTTHYGLKESEFQIASAGGVGSAGADASGPHFAASPASAVPAAPPASAVPAAPPAPIIEEAQRRLDAALEKLLPQALKANATFIAKLEDAVKSAKSFDEIELALVELLAPRMEPGELEDFLARTMTMAAGYGATSVRAEAEE